MYGEDVQENADAKFPVISNHHVGDFAVSRRYHVARLIRNDALGIAEELLKERR